MSKKDLIYLIQKSKKQNNKSINLSVKAICEKDLDKNVINELVNFEEIDLSRNMLKSLPNDFSKLKKLKKLILSENYFKNLPESISDLIELEYLDIGANALTELPKKIKKLKKLKFFYLKSNPLKKIPKEILELKNLEVLGLVNTKISEISNISKLKQLKNLWIGKNRIKKLPDELIQLESLEQITLDENPLPISKELLDNDRNPKKLFSEYIKFQEEKLEKSNETKIVILGESQAGKTSLLNRLIYDKFYDDEKKTENINIDDWILHFKNKQILKVNLWDFGGQDILYALHNFFLTDNNIFIIVWDARNENQSKKIEYWLNLINKISKKSKVIIVMNKIDEHTSSINKAHLNKIYSDIIYQNISCKNNWGITELSDSIKNVLSNNENLIYSYDDKIITLKKELQQISKPYILLKEFEDIIRKYEFKYNTEYIKDVFVNLGIALWFKDNFRLKNYVILDINWFVQNIYSIINWVSKNKENGNFIFDDLKNIFTEETNHNIQIFLIDALLGFNNIFEINKVFYFPNLLKFYENDIAATTKEKFSKFSLTTKNISANEFYKLIIAYNNTNKIVNFYKNHIHIKYDISNILIHYNEDKSIDIYIENSPKYNINDILQRLLNDFKETLKIGNIDVNIFLDDSTYVSSTYLKRLQEFGVKEYITIKSNKYIIDDIFKKNNKDKKVEIKIDKMYGDILGDSAVKNIMNNYGSNQKELIEGITNLLVEIKKSNINNKEILIENIQNKTENPSKLKEYLGSFSDMSTIPVNILTLIQSLPIWQKQY